MKLMLSYSAGVAIVLEQDSKVLLGKRAKHKYGAGLWEFPSGKIETNETIESAIIREAMEELGVKVTPKQLLNAYIFLRDGVPFILMNYYCEFKGEPKISDEHDELEWVTVENAYDMLSYKDQKTTLSHMQNLMNCISNSRK